MSAAGRGAERREHDAYFTPRSLAYAICRRLRVLGVQPQHFLEPASGEGAFTWAVVTEFEAVPMTMTVDVDPAREPKWCGRFQDFAPGEHFDLIGGNPPFREAEAFVRHSLRLCEMDGYVFFLLRAGFLHGAERSLWVQNQLRWYIPLAQRPSFTADGKTDASEYSVFVWQRGYMGAPEIRSALVWR